MGGGGSGGMGGGGFGGIGGNLGMNPTMLAQAQQMMGGGFVAAWAAAAPAAWAVAASAA